MKRKTIVGAGWRLAIGLIGMLMSLGAGRAGQAEPMRTQSIALAEGWNAVFLEVYPDETDPSVLFANTPVDMVAALAPRSTAQFLTDPGVKLFQQSGWGVWYADDRPDAFLKSLNVISGQQAYLIHTKIAHTWNITGLVVPPQAEWQAESYNFVGFSVDSLRAPTFAQFFAGSKAHRHNRIYRLANGSWRRVTNPDAELMRAGEAFWIYCDGPSQYPGPLGVKAPTRQGLVLGATGGSLVLRNDTDHPVQPSVSLWPVAGQALPLSVRVQIVGDENNPVKYLTAAKPASAWSQDLPPLEAGQAMRFPLELRLEEMGTAVQSSLLKITTDLGSEVWIPVTGVREDLEEN